MTMIRLRATGPRTGFDALLADLHGMEGVERAEELADLMPHMDDEDSSSAGLMDDRGGDVRALEIEVLSPHADRVREAAADIAGQYGLKEINSPDKFDASGTMVLVPPISTPRYLLAFYNAMLRHEDDVDAVIICGIESCEAASTVQYCTPPGKFFSLNGGLDEEELLSELRLIFDSLFAEGNQLNV